MNARTTRQERRIAAAIERKARKKTTTLEEQFQDLLKNPGFHLVVIDDATGQIERIVNDADLVPGEMEEIIKSYD